MENKLVKLKFHGDNWSIPTDWDLDVKSVGEAIRAVEVNTQRLYSELIEKDKKNIKYCLVINGRNFKSDKDIEDFTIEEIKNSELNIQTRNLKTIDIIPVIEGADSNILGIFTAILGVVLIVIGAFLTEFGVGIALIVAGIGLLAAGVFSLLSKPPTFEDFREIEQGGKTSYLFSGPQNIVGEGGPVPLAYGRILLGSQVISAAYVTIDFLDGDTSTILRNEYGQLIYNPNPPQP